MMQVGIIQHFFQQNVVLQGRISLMKANYYEKILKVEKDFQVKYFYVVVDMACGLHFFKGQI
jgi:hypothetical protein